MGRKSTIVILTILLLCISTAICFSQENMKLKYNITIENFESGMAKVTLEIDNVSTKNIKIREHGYHGYYSFIEGFKAYDDNNNDLEVKFYRELDGISGTKGKEWEVNTRGANRIKIEYSLKKQMLIEGTYHGYIGKDFGVFSGEQILLCPSEFARVDENIQVEFNIPKDSNVVTPWVEKDKVYYPNESFYSENKSTVSKLDNLMRSSLAVGDFDSYEKLIGSTKVKVAVPNSWNDNNREKVADSIFYMMEHLNQLFGKSVGNNYLVIYSSQINDSYNIWGGEWSLSQHIDGQSNNYDYDKLEHQMFHRWNGWIWGWKDNREELGVLLSEGINRYYESKSVIKLINKLHDINSEEVNAIERYYNQYKSIFGTKDMVYKIAESTSSDRDHLWTAYNKGGLICFALDMKIMEDTNNEKSLDNFVEIVNERYGYHSDTINYDDVLSILKEITNKDYSGFFDNYVFDKKYLDLNRYFEDSDGDGLPNYVEIIRGHDKNVSDQFDLDILKFYKFKNILIAADKEPCQKLNNKYFSKTRTLSGTGWINEENIQKSDVIILLDTDDEQIIKKREIKKIFSELKADAKNFLNIKYKDNKLLIYLKAENQEKLLNYIEKMGDIYSEKYIDFDNKDN